MSAESEAVAEIARQAPGQSVSYGIDHKGPWARIGDITARAKPGVAAALRAALQQATVVAPCSAGLTETPSKRASS